MIKRIIVFSLLSHLSVGCASKAVQTAANEVPKKIEVPAITKPSERIEIYWPDVSAGVLKYQAAMNDFWMRYDRNFEVIFEPYQKLYEQMG